MKEYKRSFILLALMFYSNCKVAYAYEYVAFSLKTAQKFVSEQSNNDEFKNLFNLSGITTIKGLVYDRLNEDVILVGQKDFSKPPLTLDDFVVALRSRFLHGNWPLVSIDPTKEMEKTNMQTVRFEGGVENTQFGTDLYEADYLMKRIGLGLIPSGIQGFKTYWDLFGINLKNHEIASRFWFYPVYPKVVVRDDVVAIRELKLGVFTEVLILNADTVKQQNEATDKAGEEFARSLSENFERLAQIHHSFARLQSLNELVAITAALEKMDKIPDLSFWLTAYQPKRVDTKQQVELLKREEKYEFVSKNFVYKEGYKRIVGGVELMAIALRLKAGEVQALKDAVLMTRPKPNALSWGFLIGEWIIPTSSEMLNTDDVVPLYTQIQFLCAHKSYDDALLLINGLIEANPNWDLGYYNRGNVYSAKGLDDKAILNYNKALELTPSLYKAIFNRGVTFHEQGLYEKAISDYNKVIEINPNYYQAYINRGNILHRKGNIDLAIADFTKAIKLNPNFAASYNNRGMEYKAKGIVDSALADYTKAIELNPELVEAYTNRGILYYENIQYENALSDLNKAIEINQQKDNAYKYRGLIFKNKGFFEKAINDYTKSIELNSKENEIYYFRGIAYHEIGHIDEAISDFTKAIELNPQFAKAYSTRGNLYFQKGMYENAMTDLSNAIQLNPKLTTAYNVRGTTFAKLGQFDLAIVDLNKTIEIDPQFAEAYYNLGIIYRQKKLYEMSISKHTKAINLNPKFFQAYNARGIVYSEKDLYDEAISDYNKAVEINPQYAEAYYNNARLCDAIGRVDKAFVDKAIEAYKKFIEIAQPQYAEQVEYAQQRISMLTIE